MSQTYNSEDIDPEINALVAETQNALTLAKEASDQLVEKEARILELEGQLKESHEERVELEKVASEKSAAIKDKVDQTVDHMIVKEVITESYREKIASELISNPQSALDMLDRVLNFNVTEVSTPRGESIEKTASDYQPSTPGQEDSEWMESEVAG